MTTATILADQPIGGDRSAQTSDGKQIPQNDGNIAPKEGPVQPTGSDYGPNNENLPKRLQDALQTLGNRFRLEGLIARRHEILKSAQGRYYWQGNQYLWYDYNADLLQPYNGGIVGSDDNEEQQGPRYDYILNVYQPFGLAFIAVFAGAVPTVIWFPGSLNRSDDITAAKAASDAAQLIEENNHIQQKMISAARYLWTDGKLGAYVRYVADGERFGTENLPDLSEAQAKLGEDSFVCPQCGIESPLSAFAQWGAAGQPQGGQVGPTAQPQMQQKPACPQCQQELGENDFKPALLVSVPQAGPAQSLPRGQEVIDFYGSLELNTPVWCTDFWEFPWLDLQFEVHMAKLKAAYPHVADKIEASSALSPEDVYARAKRMSVNQGIPVLHPGDVLASLVTYSRQWMRPWAFKAIENKDIRKELETLFPDGCYVAFAGQTYCESRNEKMSDHWRVMHAMPGDGQNREAVGSAAIPVQDQINTLANILIEYAEYGLPPLYVDPEVLDIEKLRDRVIEPGVHVPARPRAGQQLAAAFFQPAAATIPQWLMEYLNELTGPQFQLVTGVTAAVFGGSMDEVKTAQAYQQARDMSLGRLSLPYSSFKQMYAEMMGLAVKCFRDNRPGDVEHILPGDNSEFESRIIRVADLQGNTEAHSDPDETYPRLRSQKEAVLKELMQSDDPMIGAVLGDPANLALIKMILGLDEFVIPGEDARLNQLREIEIMLKQPGVVNPLTGQMIPTVPVRKLQDHVVHLAAVKQWIESDAGQEASNSNPQGYATIEAHAELHQQAIDAAKAPAEKKGPSQSIPQNQLPPSGQVQQAAQAGITLTASDIAQNDLRETAKKALLGAAKQPPPHKGAHPQPVQ